MRNRRDEWYDMGENLRRVLTICVVRGIRDYPISCWLFPQPSSEGSGVGARTSEVEIRKETAQEAVQVRAPHDYCIVSLPSISASSAPRAC